LPAVGPAAANIIAEIPFQYKVMIDKWMELPRNAQNAVTYITKVPGKKVELDPNLAQDIIYRLTNFPWAEGIENTGARIKGTQKVLAEVPTGAVNNIQYPYGVDVQALLDEYINQAIKQSQLPGQIIRKGGNIGNAIQGLSSISAGKLAQLARLQAQNER